MSDSIAITGMDKATARWISEEAARRGISAQSLIIEIIHKGVELERDRSRLSPFDDLDALAGSWDDEQASEFLSPLITA